MHVEHHDLNHEFPRLHDVMQELTAQNGRFRAMFSEYHRLTDEIERLEEADIPVGDFTIEDMKKKRVRLVTDAKSFSVTNGTLGKTNGLITMVPSNASSSVSPSGVACATCCVPRFPEAVGRFSTVTCWPCRLYSFPANTRALLSVTPPVAKGTISLMGRFGKS